MSETPEVKTEPVIDINKYVPKDQYEKTESELKSLRADAEKLKMQLLSDDYISFLQSKKDGPKTSQATNLDLISEMSAEDIDKLPNSKLLKLAEKTLGSKVTAETKKEVNELRGVLGDVLARLELSEVMRVNPDFDEYRADVERILANAQNDLTIQQSLDLARLYRSQEKSKDSKKDEKKEEPKKPTFSEKPGRTLHNTTVEREFKSEKEAAAAAGQQIREKYNLTGDVL